MSIESLSKLTPKLHFTFNYDETKHLSEEFDNVMSQFIESQEFVTLEERIQNIIKKKLEEWLHIASDYMCFTIYKIPLTCEMSLSQMIKKVKHNDTYVPQLYTFSLGFPDFDITADYLF